MRGEWKGAIMIALSEARHDIPAIQQRLKAANRRVLVRALRQLEDDRLVRRLPSGTEYILTTDGEALVKILRDIAQWQAARSRSLPRSLQSDEKNG